MFRETKKRFSLLFYLVQLKMLRGVNPCLLVTVMMVVHNTNARILSTCELVTELRNQGVPDNELATWVCIAQGESNLNTAAENTVNTDGSYDHGIFQINDRYWCGRDGVGGGCNVACAELRNDDVSDDIRCARHIKDLQGFSAWVAYNQRCDGKPLPDISGC